MSDRLNELLRQRAAIQAHLDWLDREIAHARSSAPAPAGSTPTPASSAETPLPSSATTSLTPPEAGGTNPDAILAGYQQDPKNIHTDVRKGCLLYFFGAFLVLGLLVASFYFVNRLIREDSASVTSEQPVEPAAGR
ncbi:MAG: hypothetical protein QM760_04380 [Nibricoccus sp.]